jgi:hypothetical protein
MSFSNPVVGGEDGELIRPAIQSPNYVPGVSGWTINRDGSAEFNNVTIRFDLATGSIVVGPPTGPQVVIRTTAIGGGIEFPSNTTFEDDPARIFSQANEADPVVGLDLIIESANTNSDNDKAYISLHSASQDNATQEHLEFGFRNGSTTMFTMRDTVFEFDNGEITTSGNIFLGDASTNGNNPVILTRGRTETSSTSTALGAGSDTLISGAAVTGAILENGIAYKVDVQIRTSSTAGAQVGGLQGLLWKIWDGAVGGTQLGVSNQKFMESNPSGSSSQGFSFLFKHTGSTGSRTINLSGQTFTGTNTNTATTSTASYTLVSRLGRVSNIVNL